jgi:hypothetical protein
VELEIDSASGTMPLLGDMHLSLPGDIGELCALGRAAALQVVLLAIDEHQDVGVLLDRSESRRSLSWGRLSGLLHSTTQLRQGQHGHIDLLCQRLEAPGDFRDLLHPPVLAIGGVYELQVVDHHQVEPALALEAPRSRPQPPIDRAGVSSMRSARPSSEPLTSIRRFISVPGQLATPNALRRDASLFSEDARHQLLGRHLE